MDRNSFNVCWLLRYHCLLSLVVRKFVSILLTVAILAQGMVSLGLWAYYEVNKKMIADKLCVNKNNPSLHCNGKCYLSKQLKKAEENEKRQSRSLTEKDEAVSAYDQVELPSFIPSYTVVSLLQVYEARQISAPHSVLTPPPCA